MPSISNLTVGSITNTTASASWTPSADVDHCFISLTGPGTNVISNATNFGCDMSSLVPGSSYTITVTPYDSSNIPYASASTSFTTTNTGSPPSGSTIITPTPQTGHQFSVTWTPVSGATGYHLFKSSDGGANYLSWNYPSSADVGNVTSQTVTIDYEWQNYLFQVTPYNSYGNGTNSYSSAVKSLDETAPSMSALSATSTLSTSVTVSATGNDNNPTSGTPSGIQRFAMYKNGSFDGYATVNGPSTNTSQTASYTFSGLTPGTTYTFETRADDYSGNLSPTGAYTISVTTTTGRPANFDWDSPKTAGSTFVAPTAVEWGKFQTRINDFRVYKGLLAYSFTTVSGTGLASDYNAARTAILDMTPPTSPPAAVVGKSTNPSNPDNVTAAQFNGIRDSLNSIT